MKLINNLRNYILEDNFKLVFINNKINIVNYISVIHFDSDLIKIKYSDGIVSIKGSNLIISRLLNDELLIEGIISNIEIRWFYER